jgi:hypothetical protein
LLSTSNDSQHPLRFGRNEEPRGDMIIRALMILVIISSLPVVCILQLPQKVMARTTPSEGSKVLVDDIIQDLKSNDTQKAQLHLNLLNQQLPTIQSVKVLLNGVTLALKNNDVDNALVHLNLVKQQLTPNASSITTSSTPVKETRSTGQTNHPLTADKLIITINRTQPQPFVTLHSTPIPTYTSTVNSGLGEGGDKFIVFIYRRYFNIQQTAQTYDPIISSGDYVNFGEARHQIEQVRSAFQAKKFIGEYASAAEIVANTAALKSVGATAVSYDLEGGDGFTPPDELANIPASVAKASAAAKKAGLEFWCTPAMRIAKQYGLQFAKYCDVINMQGGGALGNNNLQGYISYYNDLAPKLKQVNPNLKIVGQVTTIKGLSLSEIQTAIKSIANVVDGFLIWTSPYTINQVRDIVNLIR